MQKSSFDSLFCPSIDDLVFTIALEYSNLYKGENSRLKAINFTSSTKRNAVIAKTGIGYVKRSDKEVTIYLVVDNYIMRARGEHYQFDGIPIGRNFMIREHFIAFTGPPRVLMKQHYNHPFVYKDNEICYRAVSERWKRLDIKWNHWYNATDENTQFKIAKWLEQGKLALQRGYFGGVSPVHELDAGNFKSEYRTTSEAIRTGLNIIENRG